MEAIVISLPYPILLLLYYLVFIVPDSIQSGMSVAYYWKRVHALPSYIA